MASVKMIKDKARKIQERKNFGKALKAKKVHSPYAVATLLLDKFVYGATAAKEWQHICAEDFKEHKIITEGMTYTKIRNDLISKRILVCQATKKELEDSKNNDKASYFKLGDAVIDYVQKIKISRIPQRMDNVEIKITCIEEENKILKEETKMLKDETKTLKDETKELKEDIDRMLKAIFLAFPPDTEERRKIFKEDPAKIIGK